MPMPPVPSIAPPAAPAGLTEALTCQFCNERFEQPAPLPASKRGWLRPGRDSFPETPVLAHAKHEFRCKDNPNRPGVWKGSSAWTPQPFPVRKFGGAQPSPTATRLTYLGGPYHGRSQAFECFLVDGTVVVSEPPRVAPGPQQEDSKGRLCSKYMGHYELRTRQGCLVYRWVDTIVPKKKRLAQPTPFNERWPHLAAELMEEPNDDPTAADPDGTAVGDETDPEMLEGELAPEPEAEP